MIQSSKVSLAKLRGYLIFVTFQKLVIFGIWNKSLNETISGGSQVIMKKETRNFRIGAKTWYYSGYFGFNSPTTGLFTLTTRITKADEVDFLPLQRFNMDFGSWNHWNPWNQGFQSQKSLKSAISGLPSCRRISIHLSVHQSCLPKTYFVHRSPHTFSPSSVDLPILTKQSNHGCKK